VKNKLFQNHAQLLLQVLRRAVYYVGEEESDEKV
jgi:hypothetical protein